MSVADWIRLSRLRDVPSLRRRVVQFCACGGAPLPSGSPESPLRAAGLPLAPRNPRGSSPVRPGRKSKNREVDAACLRLPGPTSSRADSAWPGVRATGPACPNAKATQASPQVSAEGVAQLDGCMLGAPIDRAGRAQTPYAYAGFPSPSGRADGLSAAGAGFRPARATDRRAEDEMRGRGLPAPLFSAPRAPAILGSRG